jgi:hypothetical protein
LQKKVVDNYKPGKVIPHFALKIKLENPLKPVSLSQKVEFLGVKQKPFILISRDPQSPQGALKLDDVISRKSLVKIARDSLNKWEKLAPFLDLSRQQETMIAKSFPDYGKQKQECLEEWKEMKGKEATYCALISAAEEAEDKELAHSVHSMVSMLKK